MWTDLFGYSHAAMASSAVLILLGWAIFILLPSMKRRSLPDTQSPTFSTTTSTPSTSPTIESNEHAAAEKEEGSPATLQQQQNNQLPPTVLPWRCSFNLGSRRGSFSLAGRRDSVCGRKGSWSTRWSDESSTVCTAGVGGEDQPGDLLGVGGQFGKMVRRGSRQLSLSG